MGTGAGFERGNLHDSIAAADRSKAIEPACFFEVWLSSGNFRERDQELAGHAYRLGNILLSYMFQFFLDHHDPARSPRSLPP
jgi:hypothetical protein